MTMTLGLSGEGRKRRRKYSNPQAAPHPQEQTYQPQKTISYPLGAPSMPTARNQQYAVPPQYPILPYHAPPSKGASKSHCNLRETLSAQAGKSVTQLRSKTSQYLDANRKSCAALNHGAALCDVISSKLDAIITSIDDENFSGNEQDLFLNDAVEAHNYPSQDYLAPHTVPRGWSNPVYLNSTQTKQSNHFSKVWLYTNSRLPPHLPPFKVYMPTWPLLCLAANYSERVYSAPARAEVETHVPSDWRSGTKAMVLKSVPIDDMHTVVFSIRGSATFMDWAVNYKSAPSSPSGFLDDEGNLCHSGFLYVARKMVAPVAERLRALLQENPSRAHCSLLITGHSAGGAVAALLYAHMMNTTVQSELSYLTGFFKRVHCVTFGAPPVSLLPLQRPDDRRHRKSMFFSFINEGDPVPRADKQIIRSLLKLYASPAPTSVCSSTLSSLSKLNLSSSNDSYATLQTQSSKPSKSSKVSNNSVDTTSTTTAAQRIWNIPATTLSAAGRLVVLREKPMRQHAHADDIEAVTVDDELLRTVVYGDPLKHMMSLYKRRIEILATRAVTAGGY